MKFEVTSFEGGLSATRSQALSEMTHDISQHLTVAELIMLFAGETVDDAIWISKPDVSGRWRIPPTYRLMVGEAVRVMTTSPIMPDGPVEIRRTA